MKSTKLPKCPICRSGMLQIQDGLFDDRYGAPGKHSVNQCKKCGYGQTNPGLKKSEIGKFYQKYYPLKKISVSKIKENPMPSSPLLSWALGLGHTCHWQAKKGMRVLDIGSGSGRALIEIEALGAHAYGIEPDPTAKKIAGKLNLNVHEGFITDKPFPGLKFDLVTASQVIEHESDPLSFLLAAKSKLKKGGKIILSTPSLNSLGRTIYGARWLNWHIPYHLSFFTSATVEKLANISGLEIVSIKTVTPTLWTILQWQMLPYSPVYKKQSPVWSSLTSKSIWQKLLLVALYLIAAPYSRIIDLFGLGESLVITLEKS